MSFSFSARRLFQTIRLRRRGIARHMHVFSHTTVDERIALSDLVASLPSNANVLEIGAHIGSSALFIAEPLSKKQGRLFCVDTWANETMPDGEMNTFDDFSSNTAEFRSIITTVRKRSDEVEFSDIGMQLDLAFIDGDHSEEVVRGDFLMIEKWMKPRGVIAFHDTSQWHPGVNKVVGEALASGRWQIGGLVDTLAWIKPVQQAQP